MRSDRAGSASVDRSRLVGRHRIVEQNTEHRLGAGDEQIVGGRRLVERIAMTDQWANVEPFRRERIEHGFEVSLLGPTHEADRVVPTLLLVVLVVASRTVRAGDLEAQFLLIEVCAVQLESRHADKNDAPAFATHLRRLSNRLAATRCGSDQNAIQTCAARIGLCRGDRIGAVGHRNGLGAERAGHSELARVGVDGQHTTPVGTQQLHG